MEEEHPMAQGPYKHIFSRKAPIRFTFLVLSLSYGVAQAQPADTKAPVRTGNQYNWLAGGGG
jgi:hypothetical protein